MIDTAVAATAIIGFGASYGRLRGCTVAGCAQQPTYARESTQVHKSLQEGLGGIRDVLLDGTQPLYCDIYRQAIHALRHAQGSNAFIAQSPRYVMETLGMVLIAVLAYGFSFQASGAGMILPVLGTLALGAQRLLPALQTIFAAWAAIVGNQASLADTLELLDQPLPLEALKSPPMPLSFQHTIRLDSVRFRYNDNAPWVLDGFDFTIPKGARVGFVGAPVAARAPP